MSIFKTYSTNDSLEKEGVWVSWPENADGTVPRTRIAHAHSSNKKFQKAWERLTRPVKRELQLKTLSDDKVEAIFRDLYAETIVLGWENIKEEDGTVITYSKENVVKVFERVPYFFEKIQEVAKDIANFQDDDLEASAKNS